MLRAFLLTSQLCTWPLNLQLLGSFCFVLLLARATAESSQLIDPVLLVIHLQLLLSVILPGDRVNELKIAPSPRDGPRHNCLVAWLFLPPVRGCKPNLSQTCRAIGCRCG
ncbi:hypothetical protein GE09DRAFT_35693 [Coniochaeta sp. 2T2.1]|nr:hypothetical protein GE09DRAFT_35693 [Coniochaeta sp. 2T2.1]